MKYLILVLFLSMNASASLTFGEAMKKIIDNNVDYRRSVNDFHNAKVSHWQGVSNFIPKVNASYRYTQFGEHFNDLYVDARDFSLNMNYDLFNFGRDVRDYQSRKFYRDALSKGLDNSIITAERSGAVSIFTYIYELKNVALLKELLVLKDKSLKLAQKKFKSGYLSKQDLNKVLIDYNNLDAEILSAEVKLNTAKQNLITELGDFSIESEWPWTKHISEKQFKKIFETDYRVQSIPAWKSAYLLTQSFEKQKQSSKLNILGNFSLNIAREWGQSFFRSADWGWRASIQYTLPLFDGFGNWGNYQRDLGNFYTQKARLYQQTRGAYAYFKNSRESFRISYETYKRRLKTLSLAKDLYNNSLVQFRRGKLSVNELLVDQDRLLRTEQLANLGIYTVHTGLTDLCHSLGKRVINSCFN
jgi:outer membrane protein TolC